MTTRLGEVAQIWRYPVKTLAGARCAAVDVDEDGVVGDRLWAIWDQTWDQIASGKQHPRLMELTGRFHGSFEVVCITDEEGREYRSDDPWACARLSARLGMSVGLRRRPRSGGAVDRALFRDRRPIEPARFLPPSPEDASAEGAGPKAFPGDMDELYKLYLTTPGLFADCSPLHLVSANSLGALGGGDLGDVRRYRPNLLLDLPGGTGAFPEVALAGERIEVGGTVLHILSGTPRCSMPSQSQPGLGQNWSVGAAVARVPGQVVGVYADVIAAGAIREGDAVRLCPTIHPVATHPRYLLTQADTEVFAKAAHQAREKETGDRPLLPADAVPMRVIAKQRETANVTSFTFVPADGRALPRYLPGQHVRISLLREGEVIPRNYTLSSSPLDDGLRISVKREPAGPMSNHLHDNAMVGDVIHASMPAGAFHADPTDETPLWLVSMGIGITPMISILRTMTAEQPGRVMRVIHGARDPDDVPFLAGLEAATRSCPNLAVTLCLSGSDATMSDPASRIEIRTGRITESLLDTLPLAAPARVMICGREEFMQGLAAYFQSRDPAVAVAFEHFRPPVISRPDSARETRVIFARSGVEAVWTGEDGSLLEFAERNGIAVSSDCRAGICKRCACRKSSGAVAYFSESLRPERDETLLLCCSVPTSAELTIDL
jgi:ferredoxin-NADP reductase/uncharacterized protein YcbX